MSELFEDYSWIIIQDPGHDPYPLGLTKEEVVWSQVWDPGCCVVDLTEEEK